MLTTEMSVLLLLGNSGRFFCLFNISELNGGGVKMRRQTYIFLLVSHSCKVPAAI